MAKPNENMINSLAAVPLFSGLNRKQLEQLASRFVPRTYEAGEAIVTQGKTGFGMFTLLSGKAEAVVALADGGESVLNSFGPNDFFGEVAMLDGGVRTASVIAREKTECLVLGRPEFIGLMYDDAEMATEIAIALAKRLRRAVSAF